MANKKNSLVGRYRYSLILLRQLVVTDFKLRYQGSVLGYVWSLLRPLFLFIILYFVFVKFLRIGGGIPHYPIYLLLGIILWNFFAETTNNCVGSIVARGDIIRKLNFPKSVIVLSVAFSALINLLFNLIVVSIFVFLNDVDIKPIILIVPIFILEIFIFSLSIGFLLSALFVKLRDVNYIWEVMLQALFYATPIIYPLSLVSDRWPDVAKAMLTLNPIAQAIQDIRFLTVTQESLTLNYIGSTWQKAMPYIIVICTTVFAIIVFRRQAPKFAENV